jgi:hypothetical protein
LRLDSSNFLSMDIIVKEWFNWARSIWKRNRKFRRHALNRPSREYPWQKYIWPETNCVDEVNVDQWVFEKFGDLLYLRVCALHIRGQWNFERHHRKLILQSHVLRSWVKCEPDVCGDDHLNVFVLVPMLLEQLVQTASKSRCNNIIYRHVYLFRKALDQTKIQGACLGNFEIARESVFSPGDIVVIIPCEERVN